MRTPHMFSLILVLLSIPHFTGAQFCDDTSISRVIYNEITTNSPIFEPEITLGGDADVTSQHTRLTTTEAGSSGGFFLKSATEFQGPGGFSTKFTLRATAATGSGEAWEFIVAGANSRWTSSAPFASGSTNHGKGGWSRKGALIVEFDDRMSGANESDSAEAGAHHISVFLDGAEQCVKKMPSGLVFEDGSKRRVYIDYIGFKGVLEVFVGDPGSQSRPLEPMLACPVDIWGKLNINANNYVGFAAYNAYGSIGVEHSLVDAISIADAYRPFDKSTCAVFANCREKNLKPLCVVPTETSGICELHNCDRNHVWDITGDRCCAFIEKASWVVKGNYPGFNSLGAQAPCELRRKTISFMTDNLNCTRSA